MIETIVNKNCKQINKKSYVNNYFFEFQEEDESYEPARLEYYNNQRNWEAGEQPRRVIILRDVFTITRKRDTREVSIFLLYFLTASFLFAILDI